MAGKYDDLTHAQLVELLEKRDRTKKLGLVWERDEIEADAAVDANFIACRIDEALSDKPAPWDNLVIEGDNFDALRWLRMTHSGRVKCIYIDPPYNTGNKDWVYNDSYMDKEDRFRQSTWLEFLYRRLTLARDLLAEDGVLLVSINDDQRALLELMMDEALPGMRIGTFVWRTRPGGNDTKGAFLSDNHEHVMVFAKAGFRFSGTEKSFELYRHWDERKQDWYRTGGDLTKAHNSIERPNTYYPLYDPNTDIWYPCNPDAVWRYSSKHKVKDVSRLRTRPMEDFIADGYVHFPVEQKVAVWHTKEELLTAIETGEVPSSGRAQMLRRDTPDLDFWIGKKVGFGTPSLKRYKSELKNPTQPFSSWITPNFEADKETIEDEQQAVVGTYMVAAKEIKSVFGSKAFNYAKPVSLIRELVRQSTGPDDIVLDFFAGSATAAQAVMELNAEDGGNRRFIMVSSTEATEDDPDKNLCRDVTAERIRRLNASDDAKYANLAAGFAYLRTHEIAFEDLDYDLQPADAWAALEAMHDLPLTLYDGSAPWNLHEGETTALVLVDRFDPGLLEWLKGRDRQNLFVYAWAPGQIAQHLDGTHVDIRPVRDTLVKRFQQ
ncbi:site-specific DNA-methyltransferase [Rhodophyticola sp.]|jgi:adenine-specific DNA-methyltransferase|uniref:site-specific DNA-methyltransferase n=1 Tax=Rhodophyticola sp. TaxID=2680032 RepID=UPI003D2B49E0